MGLPARPSTSSLASEGCSARSVLPAPRASEERETRRLVLGADVRDSSPASWHAAAMSQLFGKLRHEEGEMADTFAVPAARHAELGTILAAELEADPGLLEQLRTPEVRSALMCAACSDPVQFVFTADPARRVRHFRHRADAACLWGPESARHLALKEAFVACFEEMGEAWDDGWSFEVAAELPGEAGLWQADVACTIRAPDGTVTRRLMVEVQQSPQTVDDTLRRTALRHADGWDVLWVHFDLGSSVPPRWLAAAAPTLLLDATDAGNLRIVAGHLEHHVWHLSDVASEPAPRPGEDDPVVIDNYHADPTFLSIWMWPWLRGDGLLTEPPDGRNGYAWVPPPVDAPVEPDLNVLVDTYRVYAWRQEEAEARAVAEGAARRQQVERQAHSLRGAMGAVLRAVGTRPFPARYAGSCLTCERRFTPGEDIVLLPRDRRPQPVICFECVLALVGGL